MIVSELRVLRSAAGFYIGREYLDDEFNFWGPYSRDSECYFRTREHAEAALPTWLVAEAPSLEEYVGTIAYLEMMARGLPRDVVLQEMFDEIAREQRERAMLESEDIDRDEFGREIH